MAVATETAKAPVEIGKGAPDACGPCDWFGYPGVRENGSHRKPFGPLSEEQRCAGCGELVCNRHPNPYLISTDHFVSEHGEPEVVPEQGV